MPFTPSHAVVALPFLRTPLLPAAIAIGAMAPDFPLFVRGLPLHYGLTHSLWWLPLTASASASGPSMVRSSVMLSWPLVRAIVP